mmetsp:Transcript_17831/g.20225  ORF Transcript_17831/g.20225 Transcript_17831/m.20225 type:complete len:88 (-) Transcript_17831:18-281(-)
MVLRRWATIKTVLVAPLIKSSIARWTRCSDSASRAEVASSRRRIFGFLIIALAIETLCFCPPDNLIPLSPTRVLNPSGNWVSSLMKS